MAGIAREDGAILRSEGKIKRTDCCCEDEDDYPDTDPNGDPVPPSFPPGDCCRCTVPPGPDPPGCNTYIHTLASLKIKGAIVNTDLGVNGCVDVGGGLIGKVTGGSPNHAYWPNPGACGNWSTGWDASENPGDPSTIEISYYADDDPEPCSGTFDHLDDEIVVTWEVDHAGGELIAIVIVESGPRVAWYGELVVPGDANCHGPHIVPFVNPLDPDPPGTWFSGGSARIDMCTPLGPTGPGDGQCIDVGDDFAMGFGGMLE